MPDTEPAVIVNVSLATSQRDYDEEVTFLDQDFRLVRLGTDGDIDAAEELVREWAEVASAIAVTGIREARAAGLYDGDLAAVERATGIDVEHDGGGRLLFFADEDRGLGDGEMDACRLYRADGLDGPGQFAF